MAARATISDGLIDYKDYAIRAAHELLYSDEVINAIKNANTDSEIARILRTAREHSFED